MSFDCHFRGCNHNNDAKTQEMIDIDTKVGINSESLLGRILLVPSVIVWPSSVFGRLQNPVLFVLFSKKR